MLYDAIYLRTPAHLRHLLPRPKVFAAAVTAVLTAVALAIVQQFGVEVDAAVPFLNLVEQELTYRQVVNAVAPLVAAYAVRDGETRLLEGKPAE